jgi:hypothetical protein
MSLDVYENLSLIYDENVTKKRHYETITVPAISLQGATQFTVRSEFQYRPDLISFQFFGTIEYDDYITFANKLPHPIKSYKTGTVLYIPTLEAIRAVIQ